MQAIRIDTPGGPESLQLGSSPIPEPGPGEARVQIKAAGVNFIDIYHRSGAYPIPTPFTPGMEAAGVVDAVGPGVTEVKPGDRVAYASNMGAYAQYAVVPAWLLAPLPDDVSFQLGAAIMLQGMTAHYLANSTFPIQPGHRVLIHAAAGGVGRLLVQLAKRRGGTVYATVGNEEKAALAQSAGADETIIYTQTDFANDIERLTDGKGVDVVYDSVGQATFEKSLLSLKPRGYLVLFGQSSGAVPPVDLQILSKHGSLFTTRPTLAHYIQNREELLERTDDLFGQIAAGELDVRIDSTFALADVAAAHRKLESRQSSGKILLSV